jgi:hypothetical protein
MSPLGKLFPDVAFVPVIAVLFVLGTRLGRPLGQLIDNVARGLGGGTASGGVTASAAVLAGAILITYVVLGFLGGYLTTAFFYGRVLRRG